MRLFQFVLNFIELIDTEFFVRESTQALAFFLNDISNTLVTFNSASTFLVYTVFSRRYRFFVKLLFISTCPQTILRSVKHFLSLSSTERLVLHTEK